MILSAGSGIPPSRWSRNIRLVSTVSLRRLSSSMMQYSFPVNRTGWSCTERTRVSRSTTRSPVRIIAWRLHAELRVATAAGTSSATAIGLIRTSKFVDCTGDGAQRCLNPLSRGNGGISEHGGVQTTDAVHLHRVVPREELFDRQIVTAANLLHTDHAAKHRFDDRGLAPH